ncbi:MAG: FAD:protein FMN transferase [Acidobacteria bacterium]|nr:FAD:protein FMN transferase [Acidobacteriota bacterium]
MPNGISRSSRFAGARIGLCFLLLSGGAQASAVAGPPASTIVRARYLMGTIFRIEVPVSENFSPTAAALEEALDEIGRLDAVLSNWKSDSELSRLNARAGKGATRVSPTLFEAVRSSLEWARETSGSFDPTVEPLTRRFRSETLRLNPTSAGPSGQPMRPAGGWDRIELNPTARTVSVPAGGGLDLGGIGKGMALDLAAKVLSERGIHDALLDAGGQLLALGSPPGEPGWSVAVADPVSRQRPAYALILRDVSLATSGNSERPGEILDPATGRPVEGRISATAVALDATSADALSTALFVMGPERGERWARARSDLLALFLEPSKVAGNLPRVSGTLMPAPPGHLLFITTRPNGNLRSLHVEVR